MVEGQHLTLFSSMIIPLTNYFQITDFEIKILSGILFIGVGIGSFVSGSSTSKFGRPLLIKIFLIVILLSNIIIGVSRYYIVFGFCRFIIGFSIGLITPMSLNLLAEYLPLKNRALILTGVWTGFGIGSLLIQLLMLFIMPNMEVTEVSKTILISCGIPLFTLLMNILFLEDSPRNLILRHEETKAISLLEKIGKCKLEEETVKEILTQVRSGTNGELSNSITEIFSKKYLWLTILLSIIWFFNSMVSYGPYLIATLTMSSLGEKQESSNNQIIISSIVINLIGLPSNILGGVLTEFSPLGRRKSFLLAIFISLIFLFLLLIFPNLFPIFIGLYQGFMGIAFNINATYSCEVYPTKIRDQALGFHFFFTRVGGFSSQILYLILNNMGVWWPYYFTIIFVSINIVMVLLLPFETHGQALDTDYHNSNKE